MPGLRLLTGFAALGLLVAFGARAAGAQTPPVPEAGSAAYCKQSSLTGPAFLNVLNTIIKHGDLTDIAFLQKTLGTKLTLTDGYGGAAAPKSQSTNYESTQVLNNPIHVRVIIVSGKEIQEQGDQIARVEFWGLSNIESQPNFIRDCLKLSTNDFVSFFGPDYKRGMGTATKMLNTSGKDDTKLELVFIYTFSFDDPSSLPSIHNLTLHPASVYMVSISQWK